MSKKYFVLIFLLFLPYCAMAQALSGTYHIGTSQPAPFKTITSAIARINASGVNGPVTFLLDDATYSASESFPIVINAFAGASAVNTLTIKPNSGKTVLIRANNSSSAQVKSVFDLNGADYVVFDGNNGAISKALTVYNNSTVHTSAKTVFWLRNEASFNQFKNLNILQNFSAKSDLSLGIFAGGSAISSSSSADNPNNSINNISFIDVKHLVYVNGVSEVANKNWELKNNSNSTTSSSNKPFVGFYLTKVSNFSLLNNTLSSLSEVNHDYSNFPFSCGISVKGITGTIANNQIHSVISTIANSAVGIYMLGDNLIAANNVVTDIASNGGGGTETQNGFGIVVRGGSNIKLYYNSVRLGINQSSGVSGAIYVDSTVDEIDIRNNIFINAQTSGSIRVAFYSEGQDKNQYSNLDYNNYQSNQYIGSWGDYNNIINRKTTLAGWKTATVKETYGQNITPDFVSARSLRLQQTPNNYKLQGVVIAAVTTDIDGENRIKPYMGADELSCAVTSTSFGTTQTICYNREVVSPNVGGITFSAVPFNRYVSLNVIEGLQYRIATTANDIGLVKKITLYNNGSPAAALNSTSASSTNTSASLDWTASFTGVLRIEFTATNCQTNANTDTLTATFIGGTNTVDNPNLAGTNSWIGHVYDFTNNSDIVPVPPSDTNAFANYLGSFTQTNTVSGSTILFNNNYGGDDNCYSFTAGGTGHSFRTDTFAIRYRMNTTATVYPAGCYLVNITGDDGVRLFIDGVLVFNSWIQQSTTNYDNLLVYLNGSSQLVFDYYEKNGSNVSNLNIRPASTSMASLNTIVTSGPINRCVGTTTLLDGSVVATKGNNTIDPIKYQWQSSTDNSTWTNITGAIAEDYTVPATSPSTSTVIYYRRNVFGSTANSASCIYSTTPIRITTSPILKAPKIEKIVQPNCTAPKGQVFLSDLPTDGLWTVTVTSASGTTSVTGNGGTVIIGGLNANTSYTFMVSNATCTSGASEKAVIVEAPAPATYRGDTWDTPPTIDKTLVIASDFQSKGDLNGCSCTVNEGVTMTIKSGHTLTIANEVTTKGKLILENNASLVQTTNAKNSGAIEYRRTSSPMKNFDYTYWSSPVIGQTAKLLSPNTLWDKYHRYDPLKGWVNDDGLMAPGVGYIIRTPKPGTYGAPYPETVVMPYAQPVAFKGVPNNGDYEFKVGADQFNLIGNPYPSAIDANKFMRANKDIIYGALYFWTHNTAITNNDYTADDYATFNGTGATATALGNNVEEKANDSNWYIAAGQSFFVGNAAAGSFKFTNAMRVSGNNSQFFNLSKNLELEDQKHRVWLNLTNSGGAFKQLLLGYISGATNDFDNLYDGPSFDGQTFVDFYSINQKKNLTIQGRALPFSEKDEVPLGYRSTIAGTFEISIDHRDGDLAKQEIWLEDKNTKVLHDLTQSDYSFTAIKGVENDRFVLKYYNNQLGTEDNVLEDKKLVVSFKNKIITINSSGEAIEKVQIFDLLGRKLYDKSKINAQKWSIATLRSSKQVLIVRTILANGAIKSNKIIF